MGVYIKGVTVEELMKVLICSTEFMPDGFEVVEVPTPHGRLVDVNILINRYPHTAGDFEKAPTVIEAEVE